LQRYLFFL